LAIRQPSTNQLDGQLFLCLKALAAAALDLALLQEQSCVIAACGITSHGLLLAVVLQAMELHGLSV
jgi:hypothetical protein